MENNEAFVEKYNNKIWLNSQMIELIIIDSS